MSNTSVVPYPCSGDPDPLPMEVTCRRLSTEGFPAAEQHLREHLQREDYRRGQRTSRQRTFLLSWDGAPDCRWAFDAPEGAVQNLADLQRDIPGDAAWEPTEWRSGERGAWTLQIACRDPSAKLAATLSPATDRIDYAITLTISEPGVWSGLDLHLCFNHCWAPGFGRKAVALAGDRVCALSELPNERGIWLRYALRESTPRLNALKRRQIEVRGPGSSLFPYEGIPPWSAAEKMPTDSVQTAFIATERARAGADDPPTSVAIGSESAFAVGWSYWPCTDLDLASPAIDASPAGSATVHGSIHFARCTAGELLSVLSAKAVTLQRRGSFVVAVPESEQPFLQASEVEETIAELRDGSAAPASAE